MKPPVRGACIIVLTLGIAGCFAPMSQREARTIASQEVRKYCRGACGTLTIGKSQKLKDRWLVDFDAPRKRLSVVVEDDGNAKVTAWEK